MVTQSTLFSLRTELSADCFTLQASDKVATHRNFTTDTPDLHIRHLGLPREQGSVLGLCATSDVRLHTNCSQKKPQTSFCYKTTNELIDIQRDRAVQQYAKHLT